MTTALPAMKAKFGSTEYYVVTMPAKELVERLVIPKEMEEWGDLTLEERYQRDVDYRRVEKMIAPYLANDPDRFFGAFIVDIYNADGVNFESMSEIVGKLPSLYKHAASNFGFLYLQGGELMVPLDGQHRLAALKFAISGKNEKSKPIDGLAPNSDVATDLCTVIMVLHDPKKARKIFNKVNRYAKPTSKADNLITADDDIIAIVVRDTVVPEIGDRIVNISGNTLSPNAIEFTTLSTLYETTASLLEEEHGKIERSVLPSAAEQKIYRQSAKEFWSALISGVSLFNQAVHDHSEGGDSKRQEIRASYLLGKPVAQSALVEAVIRLRTDVDGTATPIKEIIQRINKVDWSNDNSLWQNILMRGDKIVSGRQAMKFAGRFIAYYLGEKLADKERQVLEEQYVSYHAPGSTAKLPKPLY
jgi:DNA sulfur modification protein DndB